MDTLNETGALTFDFDGQEVVLTKDDLSDRCSKERWLCNRRRQLCNRCPGYQPDSELIEEGFVRE